MALDPKIIKQLRKDVEEINRIYQKIGEQPLKVDFNTAGKDDIKLIRDYLSEARTFVTDIDEGFGGMTRSIKNIVSEWKKGFATPTSEATKSFTKLKGIAEKLSDDFKGVAELRGKEVKSLKDQAKIEVERLKVLKAELEKRGAANEEEKALLENLRSEYKVQQDILDGAEKRYQKEIKIQKAMGLSGAIVKGIQGTLEKIGINSDYFDGIEDDMRKAAESGSKWQTTMVGIKGLAKGIGEALSDPLVILTMMYKTIKFLIDAVSEFSKGVSNVGKVFGIAGKQAEETYKTIYKTQDLYHFPDELIEGQKKYNEAVGFNLAYNKENAALMQDLTHYLGLSDEEAGKLVRRSRILGQDFKSMDKDMVGVTNNFNKQNKTAVPYAKVAEQISKVSASTAFNIKGGAKGLAEAAVVAARYGREIDDINNSAKQLLNFEESISNEIEAELLTGKDLNLEKLRYAALTGDAVTQAKEQERLVKENFKSLKGNVLAQEAFAKSIGMSTEDVAKMVEQQQIEADILKKEGVAGLQRHQAELKAQAEQAKAAEATDRAFKSAVMQLKASLLPLVQKITPFFIKMAENMASIGKILSGVGKILSGGVGKTLLAIIGGAGALYAGAKLAKGIGGLFSGGLGTGGGEMVGGDKPGTAKTGFLGKVLGLGGGKIGESAKNPMYVYVVNQVKGGGGGEGNSDEEQLEDKSGKKDKTLKKISAILPAVMAIGGGILQNKAQSKMEEAQQAAASGDKDKAKQLQKSAQNYQTAGESMSQTGQKGLTFQLLSGAKKYLLKGISVAGKQLNKLNPAKAMGTWLKSNGSKFIGKLLKFPVIGSILEGIFANSDIKDMIADKNISKEALSQAVGKRTVEGLGGVLGSIGGAALGSLIPIPGVGTFLGGMAGDFAGRWLAGAIADNVGAKPVGDAVLSMYKDELKDAGRPMATGGIVTGPTRALVGEAGPEAVIPLNQLMNEFKEMKQILNAILHKEGTITLNGTKMGTAMAVGSYKVQ